jgi:peptide/nickel transport system permease protein
VPFLTTFGAQLSLMVIGAIVVETVFSWRGVGSFFVEVIRFRDFPAMQATLILLIVFFVVVNLVFDILCLFVDPRIRRAAERG